MTSGIYRREHKWIEESNKSYAGSEVATRAYDLGSVTVAGFLRPLLANLQTRSSSRREES